MLHGKKLNKTNLLNTSKTINKHKYSLSKQLKTTFHKSNNVGGQLEVSNKISVYLFFVLYYYVTNFFELSRFYFCKSKFYSKSEIRLYIIYIKF